MTIDRLVKRMYEAYLIDGNKITRMERDAKAKQR